MFFWNSCFFNDQTNVGNLISGSSAFSKSVLNIWKLTVHILLKPVLENFEHYFASVWDECNCVVVSNCQHPLDHQKSKRVPEKIYFCFIEYAKVFDCVDHNKLWKILKEMGIPDHLTRLLRNLYAGQEATVKTGHGTTDWFQIGKGVHQGCILSLCLFNLYAEYIMRNAGLEEAQLESRLPGEISITSDMQMTPALWQKVKRN